MFSTLGIHQRKLLLVFGLALAGLVGSLIMGDAKPWAEIDWLDVLGEGGAALALAVWMLLILGSRPAGRVTDLLTLGMGFMFLAMWQDNLDEFIHLPAEQFWDQWLESGAMPVGIVLLTYGLVHWHQEQLSINQQLRKREQRFREHRFIDKLTQLGRVDYLKAQLQAVMAQLPTRNMVLLMVDVDNFADVNRRYGHQEGDTLLYELSELMLLNLRQDDLICRYAADRFAVVLPDTGLAQGRTLAIELTQAVQHFAYKHKTRGDTLYQTISIGLADWQGETTEALVQRANQALFLAKSSGGLGEVA
ncbi:MULTISPECIES: GGDEF domain-containing protein [unclassified Oceanobacter]|jgi:diguanylate cyclase (GGDEF)-like protein|uniref:GGDEF domain-containing protein n=1 Tax=unclassified Oceanobacter TaxID=2620260 RepID=UPI0026E2C968|nr:MULTISPECIES: GGDEF domain-containing protein [unclassified Oceanobacter]MDO6683036.1 GGDEF domain-containing protein [Oceanobacter sp. 5_MG-2023]MDP2507048.1 GGDEF domain-containing protein [Oceanobacter sp. 3_MG-2023]MDP2609569.1 GGDEF domain-containing protein [Oceanobacter sp. 1_MG-2023]MDP2612970.1 GGDEF domain-containing protein [Oceanobacter sp. 2_MG-2023]